MLCSATHDSLVMFWHEFVTPHQVPWILTDLKNITFSVNTFVIDSYQYKQFLYKHIIMINITSQLNIIYTKYIILIYINILFQMLLIYMFTDTHFSFDCYSSFLNIFLLNIIQTSRLHHFFFTRRRLMSHFSLAFSSLYFTSIFYRSSSISYREQTIFNWIFLARHEERLCFSISFYCNIVI